MDPSRAAELTGLIQRLDAEIPIDLELLAQVDQALTHVSTGRASNLERLEFLGDAVLRLAATEFIDRHHADLSVGACSNLRAQLVSDRWLAAVGATLAIETHLLLGRHAQGDRSAQSRLRADATEALIGALYTALGNLQAIHRWLAPHWHATAEAVLATPHEFNSKSSLQEWTQGQGLGLPTYRTEERSKRHGDPERFQCQVSIQDRQLAEAKGRSRKEAEQNAAAAGLQILAGSKAPQASQ
ncbi:ribonuclease III [Synechococcus sp. HB1133]|uniref:ribonuclease III n=1 Tax=unclassified Synechococcus TaxID=2626047 RepID=UPI00140C0A10|nr:ribonuclease III [Synechococcus sp. PH41509]MCB4421391.1 ribonuclease III [Synechococcus sp. HB1133]MCB4431258.1 ribonuclease III [Synechococcus sp. HBA1120]NHI80333.1 ribonuclease III [Synechococcus sp. HB1133]